MKLKGTSMEIIYLYERLCDIREETERYNNPLLNDMVNQLINEVHNAT